MTYSLTERKRIRKSFAKRAAVLNVPFLLATQLEFGETPVHQMVQLQLLLARITLVLSRTTTMFLL